MRCLPSLPRPRNVLGDARKETKAAGLLALSKLRIQLSAAVCMAVGAWAEKVLSVRMCARVSVVWMGGWGVQSRRALTQHAPDCGACVAGVIHRGATDSHANLRGLPACESAIRALWDRQPVCGSKDKRRILPLRLVARLFTSQLGAYTLSVLFDLGQARRN
eukprot:682910-Prymnesium_polylepis.1